MKQALILIFSLIFSQVSAKGIKYIEYHQDKIPNIVTAAGIASEIILEDDEIIEYATFGFDSAWDSQIIKDHILIFKSKDAQPETNLLIHTNKRHYVFTVTVGNNDWEKNPNSSGAVYSTRVIYRDSKSKKALATAQEEKNKVLRNLSITENSYINTNYDFRATDNAFDIIPTRVWDNGIITFLMFKNGTKRGVIYELNNRKASLINQHTEKNGIVVVHGIYRNLIIRLGDEAVELRRNHLFGQIENNAKTNVTNTVRTMDSEAPTEFKRHIKKQDVPQSILNSSPEEEKQDLIDQSLILEGYP